MIPIIAGMVSIIGESIVGIEPDARQTERLTSAHEVSHHDSTTPEMRSLLDKKKGSLPHPESRAEYNRMHV